MCGKLLASVTISPIAVLIDTIVAYFLCSRMNGGIGIIAISINRSGVGGRSIITIKVVIIDNQKGPIGVAIKIPKAFFSAVTVLIDPISNHLYCTREDCGVAIITVALTG